MPIFALNLNFKTPTLDKIKEKENFNPKHLSHHHMHSQLYCASLKNYQQNKMNPNACQMDLQSFR